MFPLADQVTKVCVSPQDDEINLQCQLVEKLKEQMLDQDEVRAHSGHTLGSPLCMYLCPGISRSCNGLINKYVRFLLGYKS
jgi:hypothetical protein